MESIDTCGGYLVSRKNPTERVKTFNLYITEQKITGGLGFLDVSPIPHFKGETIDDLKSHLYRLEQRVYYRNPLG